MKPFWMTQLIVGVALNTQCTGQKGQAFVCQAKKGCIRWGQEGGNGGFSLFAIARLFALLPSNTGSWTHAYGLLVVEFLIDLV